MAETDRDRWNARYRDRGVAASEPDVFLLDCEDALPREGRALDLAGGTGRHALWLARRGLRVTLADVSDVALDLARDQAEIEGLEIEYALVDLEREDPPQGPWHLIVLFHYLERGLLSLVPSLLGPGGVWLFVQPTVRNLERNAHPSARFLLQEGELAGLVDGLDLDILRLEEGWMPSGRHEARLLARKC